MGLGTLFLAGSVLGIFMGVFIAVTIALITGWLNKRKAMKKDPDIVERIKSQEVKDGNSKKESSSSSGEQSFGTGESDVEESTSEYPNQDELDERERVQIPNSGFTLRD